MLQTIRHQDTGKLVVVAKLLTGYLRVNEKIADSDSYIKVNGTFDADFVAFVTGWQSNHECTPDGIIGPATWTAISKNVPTCSTSKNRISGYTLAIQILIGGNIDCDAIYGPRTKAAVSTFQDANRLSVDGICGPKTWNALIVGADVKPEPGPFVQPVDYKQYDSRWANKMYSNHNDPKQTMKSSGCGPTACADVVATMKDPSVNPWTLAQLAMDWGDRTYNSGTAWAFFKHVADKYGFYKFVQTKSFDQLKACLDAGGYVVCSMGPGYWTNGGHYICAWKYDDTYVYCNDPASATRKKQKISAFKSESKQYFCYYPEVKKDIEGDGVCGDCVIRGDKVCDISKYEPDVDYDAFIADTALIILRAGYRGEGTTGLDGKVKIDPCFIKHADALKARGVRFGVYFYSIANTVAKAREEAQGFVQYAKSYNPLFWAIDAEKVHITTEAIGAFADELRELGCGKIGAYVANEKYDDPYHFDKVRDKYSFLWIPDYRKNIKVRKCDMWQYTDEGRVAGIGKNVDLNRITGEGHTLDWFCGRE